MTLCTWTAYAQMFRTWFSMSPSTIRRRSVQFAAVVTFQFTISQRTDASGDVTSPWGLRFQTFNIQRVSSKLYSYVFPSESFASTAAWSILFILWHILYVVTTHLHVRDVVAQSVWAFTVRCSIPGRVNRLLGSKRRPEKLSGLMGIGVSFSVVKAGRGCQLSHLHLVSWLRMSGTVPFLPPFAFMACIDDQCEQKEKNVESWIM